MKYVTNELLRCKSEMLKASGTQYSYLWAIQQALQWALDPMGYAAPVDTVLNDKVGTMDTQAEGCLAVPRPLPSSEMKNGD